MPTRTFEDPSETRIHSCSAVYFRSEGTSDMGSASLVFGPLRWRPWIAGWSSPDPTEARSRSMTRRHGVFRSRQTSGLRDRDLQLLAHLERTACGAHRCANPAGDVQGGVKGGA